MSHQHNGVELIVLERLRQIKEERFDRDHDDAYSKNELLDGAVLYAHAARWAGFPNMTQPMPIWARDNHGYWPWHDDWWKPSEDPVRNLVKAGALIAAEIDRILRAREDER